MKQYKNLNDYQVKNYQEKSREELIDSLDDLQGIISKQKSNDIIGGCYSIEVYKNKIPVQTLTFGWDENPHGANFSEVQDLANALMKAYQDYDSLIETKIIISDDWDELPPEQRKLIDLKH